MIHRNNLNIMLCGSYGDSSVKQIYARLILVAASILNSVFLYMLN